MQEIKIGETFEYKGRKLSVKEGGLSSCKKCAFGSDIMGCIESLCCNSERFDGKSVYFEEVNNG